jgi:hypothetical protein
MPVVVRTAAPAASPSAYSHALCLRRDLRLRGGRSAPARRRPGRAQQTGTARARPSRFAVAFGEPGPAGAAQLPVGWPTAYGETPLRTGGVGAFLLTTPLALGLLAAQAPASAGAAAG